MSRLLYIGETEHDEPFEIDLDDYAQTGLRIGIFGSSGAGKGYLLGAIIEDVIAAGLPTIMLDAEHELWTFKEVGALVIGGAEGDAPFVESPGALDAVIRYALDTATPIVFDVGEQAEAEEAEAARLGELVMRRLWAVLDRHRTEAFFAATEASIFAPQQVPRGTHLPAMMRQMFQRGRKRGLMMAIETQRMADIQKAVISQSNVSFYGQLNKHTDYRAVERELQGRSYEQMRATQPGTFYATPAAVEVDVRTRRVTHGGGGPGAKIEIHERERVGLDEVLRLLREGAPPAAESPIGAYPFRGDVGFGPKLKSLQGVTAEELRDAEIVERSRRDAAEAQQERDALATRLEEARIARQRAEQAAETALADAALLRERAERLDALSALLRALVGDPAGTGAPIVDPEAIRRLVREEVARQGPAGAPVLVPVEALRQRYLEAAAERLTERVRALDLDQREALLFLLAHPEGVTINAVAVGIAGSDSGGVRSRYSAALQVLVGAGLAKVAGSGSMKRYPTVDEWIRAGLGPHEATPEETAAVRDRAISLLLAAQA